MSESNVIGIIANHPDQFFIAKDLIVELDFDDQNARLVWQAMIGLAKKDIPTAYIYLVKELNEYAAEWLDVAKGRVFGQDVIPHCQSMLEVKRKADLTQAIYQATSELDPASYLEKALDKFRDVKSSKSLTFKELIGKTVDYIEDVSEGGGILTGIQCVDRQMNGLQNSRVMVVAARTGVGKTALTMQMALSIASRGIGVGVCSLEMGDAELGIRSISHATQANVSGLYRAEDEALQKMSAGMSHTKLAEWNMHFNTDQYKLGEVMNQIRLWVKRDDVKIAFVDHIGLIEVPEAKSTVDRISTVTRAIKKLAKDLDIPIVIVSQLNRGNEKENRKPRLSDLRDSGSIEQDADMVLLMHEVKSDQGEYIKHELMMAKNRQGPTGLLDAVVTFDGQKQTFREDLNPY